MARANSDGLHRSRLAGSIFGKNRPPVILQSEAAECGLASLAMVSSYHGHEIDLTSLRRRFSISMKGITLKNLILMAERLGLHGRALRLEPDNLNQLQLPAILHWDMNHFVVLVEADARSALIHDPASGARRYSLAEISRHFTGVSLELTPGNSFEPIEERVKLPLSQLVGRVPGFWRSMGQALVVSLLLQLVVLAAPLYAQLAIDEAVARNDASLMAVLAIGFALLVFFRSAADWLRSFVLVHLASILNFKIGTNLFRHMLKLPLDWFERRHVGDLISRFGSTLPIRNFIAEGAVAATVDGLMAILTLTMLFVYSTSLALVVLGAFLLATALRLGSFRMLRRREEDTLTAISREQTTFIETARAVQSLKVFGLEAERHRLWQNRHARVIAMRARLARMQAILRTGSEAIYGLELVLVVYLAALAAIDARFTVGMIFAFLAYRQQFVDKATKLLESAIQYRMLDLHLDRISDIALAHAETGTETAGLVEHEVAGAIELQGVVYRYADTDTAVLDGVDLKIDPGEFVAITGPSGGGKTTLLKVMLGLFRIEAGKVLIDGKPLDRVGAASFRSRVGAVMQDDQLLAGSIAENISMFDCAMRLDWTRDCARMAAIDDEIMAMPMNYNTLVGDLGSALSGGQRQRVLLARALYRRPRILFMDEGTSHLDVTKEREVNRALSELDITRIVIAHRPETIASADRVIELADGKIR
jgi:ATP-binding cassette subfamily B protein RaxB